MARCASIGAARATCAFAWFKVGASVGVNTNSNTTAITTVASNIANVNLDAVWSAETNLDDLVMTNNASGTLSTYAINDAGVLVLASEGTHHLYGTATVSLDYETPSGQSKKTKADYVGAAGKWKAVIELTQDKTGTHASDPDVVIGTYSAGSFTDDADGKIDLPFQIGLDGTLTITPVVVAVRINGDGISNLGNTGATQTPDAVLTNGLAATLSVGSTATFVSAL